MKKESQTPPKRAVQKQKNSNQIVFWLAAAQTEFTFIYLETFRAGYVKLPS